MNTDKIYAESIVNEYSVKEDSKVKALKRLDKKAKLPSEIFAYTFGIISSLVLGAGMCLSMEIIGSGTVLFIVGIIIGLLGIVGCGVNYSIYKKIRKAGMARYANDIMLLTNDIANNN